MSKDIVQRSTEWRKQRIGKITGSVAGAALGLSPHMTKKDLIRSMVREYHGAESEFVGNIATDFGTNHETEAILAFERESGVFVDPVGFLEVNDWLGASPDGITTDRCVLEIKVQFGLRHEENPTFKTLAEQPHYYAQVQIEMMAARLDKAYFVQYRPQFKEHKPVINIEVIHLDNVFIDTNLHKLKAVHEEYLKEIDNPEHLQDKRQVLTSRLSHQLVDRIGELDEAIANLQEERKDMLERLIAEANEKDALIGDKKLTKVTRKGSITSSALIKHFKLDNEECDSLRGKPSVSWRLS